MHAGCSKVDPQTNKHTDRGSYNTLHSLARSVISVCYIMVYYSGNWQLSFWQWPLCVCVYMCLCVCAWLGAELDTVGAAVLAHGGEVFVLNAHMADTLLRIHLPASVCRLFDDSELDCSDNAACVFCADAANQTRCYAATQQPPAGYVYLLTYLIIITITVNLYSTFL